ncbi:glycosyltransferase family 2 protein [Streptomyces sp. NPDC007107]|uniref:glycosyltransferase family 2 protein n=1 Tax=Streptomyces sp. NPDC007107 TaxID=3156915 RepID=UPI0034008056
MRHRNGQTGKTPPSPDIGRLGGLAVAELELDAADGTGVRLGPVPGGPPLDTAPRDGGDQRFLALVRLRGRPVGTVVGRVRAGDDPAFVLAGQAADEIVVPAAPEECPPAGDLPRATVVVATRERPERLARALDSLLAQDHPDFEIVVVDNAPATGATRDLIASAYAGRGVRYVLEPVPGLAAAHNRGVAVAGSEILAFTDDDVIADPHWLTALTRPFGEHPRPACVTGLILPARLTTPAQVLLESHGGFAKGFTERRYDPAHPPADEPLFPFTAGRFGSGANMAFRAGPLRAIGGFDPATGTGTAAKGGDDLYAFVRLLAEGHPLHYTPDAIVWHHHRERWEDLCGQAYGYGAGLTASLTALLVRRPALLPPLLARLPRGLAHARAMTAARASGAVGRTGAPGAHGASTYPWPRHLSRLERRGLLYGPLGYVRARLAVRGAPLPWEGA